MREMIPAHVYEVRPRKDERGVDLISDALPFGRLWYDTHTRFPDRLVKKQHDSTCRETLRVCRAIHFSRSTQSLTLVGFRYETSAHKNERRNRTFLINPAFSYSYICFGESVSLGIANAV